jgi:CTD small phosphatase-like protein 2
VVRDNTENEIFSPGALRWDGHDDGGDDIDNLDRENHESVVVTAAQRKVTDDDDNLSRHSDASLSVMEIDVDDEFNPWQFIKSLPPYSSVSHLAPSVALGAKDPRFDLTLVLDLDETLVHCTVEPVDDADFCFPVLFHGMEYQVYVRLRPHLFEFLKRIQDLKMETIVFTASQKVYADELLNRIDPGT